MDPTWWSYRQENNPRVKVCPTAITLRHNPHGMGSIWRADKSAGRVGPVIPLNGKPSSLAHDFLEMFCPGGLDIRAWALLANGAMEGWPAAEIIALMDDTPELRALVPIDILGMLTDRNPDGLYR